MAVRGSQQPVEAVLLPDNANVRVSQLPSEAVVLPTSQRVHASQLPVEAVVLPTSQRVRAGQLPVEVVVTIEPQGVGLALVDQSATAFAPTVELVAASVDVGLIDQSAVALAPTLTTVVVVDVGLVDQTASPLSPTVSSVATIALGLVDQTAAAFSATVTAGAVVVSVDLIDRTGTPFAPVVTAASLQLVDLERITRTAEAITPVYNSQYLRPQSDVTNTGTNGFGAVDETTASDADFWYGDNNVAETLEVALTDPAADPLSSTRHVFRYRIAKTNAGTLDGGGNAVTVTATLLQGTTTIRADSARTATGTWTTYEVALTGGEADAITNYDDLRLRFVTSASGGSPANRRGGAVSWAEMEIPPATPTALLLDRVEVPASTFAPTVQQASVSAIIVGLIDRTAVPHAPVVTSVASVVLATTDQTAVALAPSVSTDIALGLIDQGATASAPTVSATSSVVVDRIDQPAAASAPVVSSVADVALGLVDQTAVAFAPSLGADLSLGLISQAAATFDPTITTVATVALALIDQTSTVHAPTVGLAGEATIIVGLIDQSAATFAPSVSLAVSFGLITQTAAPFSPAISATSTITLGRITQTATASAPTALLMLKFVTLGLITQTASTFEPTSVVIQIVPDGESEGGVVGTLGFESGFYMGQTKAVHTRPETFSVTPAGPALEDGSYVGQSQAVLQDDRSPDQFDIDDLYGPFLDAIYYKGRSQAIHVFGSVLEEWPPVDPIPGCKCCEEQACSSLLTGWEWDSGSGDGAVGSGRWTINRNQFSLDVAADSGLNDFVVFRPTDPDFYSSLAVAGGFTISGTLAVPYLPAAGDSFNYIWQTSNTLGVIAEFRVLEGSIGRLLWDLPGGPLVGGSGWGPGDFAITTGTHDWELVIQPSFVSLTVAGQTFSLTHGVDTVPFPTVLDPTLVGLFRVRMGETGSPTAGVFEMSVTEASTNTDVYGCGAGGDHAMGDCDSGCVDVGGGTLLATHTFADKAWSGRVVHQLAQQFNLVTGAMITDIEQYSRAINAGAEGSYEGRANAQFQLEGFGRGFVRHTAPVGATHAILRLRMYAESQIADQGEIDAVGNLPTPWEIWTWDPSVEWASDDTNDLSPPTFSGSPAGAATAYNGLVSLLTSGSLITDGSDGPEAQLSADNDQVAVAIPITGGEVYIAFVVPESIGSINGSYSDPGDTPDQYGIVVPRFPDLRALVDFDLTLPFQDIDDSVWGSVAARPALSDVNGFSSQRYELEFYDGDPQAGGVVCEECVECEDPSNPGFPIPPFTPGFLPVFRPQIGDPTTVLDRFICTMESGAMVLDWHTRGAVSVWGGELIPFSGRTEASIVGNGTNLGDVRQAWSHYGQNLEIRSGGTWSSFLQAISQGRAVILQGDYGEFTLAERCQDSLETGHAVAVFPYQSADRLLVGDPICGGYKAYKISSLQAYAEALGVAAYGVTSPQKILFAVSRPWVP